jgi:hypothetical protein
VTVLVTATTVTLALLLGGLSRDLADVAAKRARAQLAADAGALAAVHESGPYGGGSPVDAARRFATANQARVTECICDPGATEMEVEVVLDDVLARARAAIDLDLISPAPPTGEAGGLHPRMSAAVDRLLRAANGAVWIVSGYRDPSRQQELWEDALARYGDPEIADNWVAPPGHSMHNRGLAVDLGGDVESAARLIDNLGLPLWRPMSWEPWHFELIGSRSWAGTE